MDAERSTATGDVFVELTSGDRLLNYNIDSDIFLYVGQFHYDDPSHD